MKIMKIQGEHTVHRRHCKWSELSELNSKCAHRATHSTFMLLYIRAGRNVILYGGLPGKHRLEVVYYQRFNLKLVLFMRKALPSSLLDCFSGCFKSHYCLSQDRAASHLPTEIVNKQIFFQAKLREAISIETAFCFCVSFLLLTAQLSLSAGNY